VADRALAETDLLPATAREDGLVFTRAMLAAMRGDVADAQARLHALDPVEARWDSVQMNTWYLRSRAVIRLSSGDSAGALADGLAGVQREPSGGNAGNAAWVAVQAGAAQGDRDSIDAVLRDTAALRGRWFEAVRATARVAGQALAGDTQPAAEAAAQSLAGWVDLDLPLDHALATIALAWVLPAELFPDGHLARARATLASMSAAGLLARLDAAVSA
jgi:hypothetical protein